MPLNNAQRLSLLVFFLVAFLHQNSNPVSAAEDVPAVGQLILINPETGSRASCSATLIAPSRVVSVASCLLSEETTKQAQNARICFRQNQQRQCYQSRKILTHSNYLSSTGVNDANNLAYIELERPVNGIKPIKELSPKQFEKLLGSDVAAINTLWVGYDKRAVLSRTPIKKSHTELSRKHSV